MKKTLLVVGILVFDGIGSGEDLLACGDKFLVTSRGTRYQRAASGARPPSILVYIHAIVHAPKAFEQRLGRCHLRKAGYRMTSVVETTNELEQALRQGGWDMLLTDLADSRRARPRRGAAAPMRRCCCRSRTTSPAAEIAQAKKDYQRVLKGPIKTIRVPRRRSTTRSR